jgi:hypothetical protein
VIKYGKWEIRGKFTINILKMHMKAELQLERRWEINATKSRRTNAKENQSLKTYLLQHHLVKDTSKNSVILSVIHHCQNLLEVIFMSEFKEVLLWSLEFIFDKILHNVIWATKVLTWVMNLVLSG